MSRESRPSERRAEALSKERIVEAAIAILDADGVGGLTVRTLAARLATGSGAIYWHVADKDELLAAATDQVLAEALVQHDREASPRQVIRAVALAVFDTIDAHPWIGAQISGDPWQYAVLRILEAVGVQVIALGLPEAQWFNATTALLSFMLGLAGQYAVRSRHLTAGMDRTEVLSGVAAQWAQLDPDKHPFVRRIAATLPGHDDRDQFMGGIDLILAGIEAGR